MQRQFNIYDFVDYPPTEILNSKIYLDSFKRLSFQYRTNTSDKLLAYIAFSKETPNNHNLNLNIQGNGCRILDMQVYPKICMEVNLSSECLRYKMLAEAEYVVGNFLCDSSKESRFDYLWTEIQQETIQLLTDAQFTIQDNIAYKKLRG